MVALEICVCRDDRLGAIQNRPKRIGRTAVHPFPRPCDVGPTLAIPSFEIEDDDGARVDSRDHPCTRDDGGRRRRGGAAPATEADAEAASRCEGTDAGLREREQAVAEKRKKGKKRGKREGTGTAAKYDELAQRRSGGWLTGSNQRDTQPKRRGSHNEQHQQATPASKQASKQATGRRRSEPFSICEEGPSRAVLVLRVHGDERRRERSNIQNSL